MAVLRKTTCNLRHPMGLRHNVSGDSSRLVCGSRQDYWVGHGILTTLRDCIYILCGYVLTEYVLYIHSVWVILTQYGLFIHIVFVKILLTSLCEYMYILCAYVLTQYVLYIPSVWVHTERIWTIYTYCVCTYSRNMYI